MKKRMQCIVAILALMATLVSLLSGCGDLLSQFGGGIPGMSQDSGNSQQSGDNHQSSGDNNQQSAGNNQPPADSGNLQDALALTGDDVFDGESFNEMIWGYYEVDCYEYNGSNEDAKEFLTDMEFITVESQYGERELAALPLSMQAGKYAHFVGTFSYEGEYYEPYTELGRSMFRKAYIAEVGDMTEEEFQKIENILDLDVVEMTIAGPEGNTFIYTLAYEINGNMISIYDLAMDEESYDVTIGSEPLVQYYFRHDGGKLSLLYKNVQRDYVASGYKETDPSLSCSGYALNENQKYEDLEGFTFFRYGADDDISVYVDLSKGESPVDPTMELDTTTGEFSISWQERWITVRGNTEKIADSQTISGKIVPCTSYGFTNYAGFFLFIDGQRYDYLMSQEEYEERMYSTILGGIDAGDVNDRDLEAMEEAKRNILEELKKALDAAGIAATIDTVSGQVNLEANFLFATNSSEISADGQDYLNRFIDAYTSVVLGEDYGAYISKIVIEGHTDTSGSYALNQALSEDRANAVASHCIARSAALSQIIETKGCSYDFPVYNEDGTVNMDKSRRVTFSFVFGSL